MEILSLFISRDNLPPTYGKKLVHLPDLCDHGQRRRFFPFSWALEAEETSRPYARPNNLDLITGNFTNGFCSARQDEPPRMPGMGRGRRPDPMLRILGRPYQLGGELA
jgi:hypothetical protein